MDESEIIRQAMSLLGKRTSERKKLSSKLNAMRPRKKRKQTDSKSNANVQPNEQIAKNKV